MACALGQATDHARWAGASGFSLNLETDEGHQLPAWRAETDSSLFRNHALFEHLWRIGNNRDAAGMLKELSGLHVEPVLKVAFEDAGPEGRLAEDCGIEAKRRKKTEVNIAAWLSPQVLVPSVSRHSFEPLEVIRDNNGRSCRNIMDCVSRRVAYNSS